MVCPFKLNFPFLISDTVLRLTKEKQYRKEQKYAGTQKNSNFLAPVQYF